MRAGPAASLRTMRPSAIASRLVVHLLGLRPQLRLLGVRPLLRLPGLRSQPVRLAPGKVRSQNGRSLEVDVLDPILGELGVDVD